MSGTVRIRVETSFADIAADDWGRLSGASRGDASAPYNPFVSHAFLSALENSGCATAETGWLGQHLLLEDDDGGLLGALPVYLKNHSQGEYVFDHGWADALERAGGRYYPKLQAAIPFTPATGPRLLHRTDQPVIASQAALAEGLKELSKRHGV
ncbi:peptidogalycan biosysnthesis protein, partial [Shinella sp.]